MSEFVFGRQPVLESLKAGTRHLHKIWIQSDLGGDILREIETLARAKGIPVERAPRPILDKKVQGHHQGVVAQVSAVKFLELDEFIRSLPHPDPLPDGRGGDQRSLSCEGEGGASPGEAAIVLVALDEIQDPHNVGAILRSAGFFGAAGVIVPRWRSAPVGETAARVSSGAIEHVPVIRVRNLADALLQLKEAGFTIIGADMEGKTLGSDPQVLASNTKGSDPMVLVLGSEGRGLRRLVRERCDKLLAIPGAGAVGSLNVAAAAAVFLYEFCRRSSIGRATPL
jgi:23S rRNA (guanosine2251-2'-O)-methyltransferase